MVLPVLDYCDVAWHECGQDYFKLVASKLSTDQIMTKLNWEPLCVEDGHIF